MEHREFESILQKQQIYFATGDTLPGHRRKAALKKLQKALEDYEQQLIEALQGDLGKSGQEAYMCEIGLVKSEISYMLRHLTGYVREHRVHTPLAQSFSRSFVKPAPYGCVLMTLWLPEIRQ